jgi:hypothetical protein
MHIIITNIHNLLPCELKFHDAISARKANPVRQADRTILETCNEMLSLTMPHNEVQCLISEIEMCTAPKLHCDLLNNHY